MKNYQWNIAVMCLVTVTIIGAFSFIRATPHEYDRSIGSLHQIREMNISSSSDSKELTLSFAVAHGTKEAMKPTVEILDIESTPLYYGEKLKISNDSSQGKYVVAVNLYDTRLQEAAKHNLNIQGLKLSSENHIVKHIRAAYPADDSQMIIYIGCADKPIVEIDEDKNLLVVRITPSQEHRQE